ncbi:MAG: hypothetical protein COV70_03320 [Parcubacteria group bacterium CG11_big_fil_rev_8_21_14_0_20_39_22]|nr:MAG: hypothetical protein COV70_03320 [Parcubacteria group bacterium CG11_big_fil_rev_8_21_14_0_20_39_22]
MKNVFAVYKKRGETPLECLERFRDLNPKYKDEKMTYAGRLDPLAEGVLILLAGDSCLEKEYFLNLPKTYEIVVLFGTATDTADLLGLVTKKDRLASENLHPKEILLESEKIIGTHNLPYPIFSSKTVEGKPLFAWAREGKSEDITLPKRDMRIFSSELVKVGKINSDDLEKAVFEATHIVNGDFRQEEIREKWQKELADEEGFFTTANITISCASGSYMRSIAELLGDRLGLPALAFSIVRTKVGDYGI